MQAARWRIFQFFRFTIVFLVLMAARCSTPQVVSETPKERPTLVATPSETPRPLPTPTPVPRHEVIATPWGELFIPETVLDQHRAPLLVIHFHGSGRLMREEFLKAGLPGVLLTMERSGLSAKYEREFRSPRSFEKLVNHCLKVLSERLGQAQKVRAPTQVMVSSFSAGFGAVREILKQPFAVKAIEYVSMIDSLHAGFIEQPRRLVLKRIIDTELLESFVAYAKLAAAGKKHLMLTHSAIRPNGYASTTEVSEYLLAAVGKGKTSSCVEEFADLWPAESCKRKGHLTVVGYPGDTAPDHIEQMHHMEKFFSYWKRIIGPQKLP